MAVKNIFDGDLKKQKRVIRFLYWFIFTNFIKSPQPLMVTITKLKPIASGAQTKNNSSQRPGGHTQNKYPPKNIALNIPQEIFENELANHYHQKMIINGNLESQVNKLKSICHFLGMEFDVLNALEITIQYQLNNKTERIHLYTNKSTPQAIAYEALIEMSNRHTLTEDNFAWIEKNNTRQVNYIWGYIRTAEYKNNNFYSDFRIIEAERSFHNQHDANYLFDELGLSAPTESPDKKLETTKEFFDFWSVSYEEKIKAINSLEESWIKISKDNKFSQWCDQNYDLIEKIWSYVIKKYYSGGTPIWVTISSSDTKERNSQIKTSLVTFYDLLSSSAEKRDLFKNIKSNASDKRYDINTAHTERQLNTKINKDTKERLDRISNEFQMTMRATLERLIDNEFKKLNLPEK